MTEQKHENYPSENFDDENQLNPDFDPNLAWKGTEAGVSEPEQIKTQRPARSKTRNLAKGVAATAAAAALFLPSPESADVFADGMQTELSAEQDDAVAPTPGYERGRAKEVMATRAEEQHLDIHEPTTYGREVLPGESIPTGTVDVVDTNGQRNPDFDFSVASKSQGTDMGIIEPEKVAGAQNAIDNIMDYRIADRTVNQGDPLNGGLPGPTEKNDKEER